MKVFVSGFILLVLVASTLGYAARYPQEDAQPPLQENEHAIQEGGQSNSIFGKFK
jgi:hypothetical protein